MCDREEKKVRLALEATWIPFRLYSYELRKLLCLLGPVSCNGIDLNFLVLLLK